MRIGIVTSAPAEGLLSGTAAAVAGLRGGLVALGHEVVTLRPQGPPRGSLLVHRLLFNLALSRALATLSTDLLVGVGLDGFLWARRQRLAPYVVLLRELVADRFNGGSRFLRSLQARLEAGNAQRADGVVVPSQHVREAVRRRYGVAPERLRVVPEGINLARWRAPAPSAGDGATILCAVPRSGDAAGAEFVQAFAIVHRALPSARAVLVSDHAARPGSGEKAERLGLSGAVLERAVTDEETLRACYQAADLFCLPRASAAATPFFLAAMASGLPIVATTDKAVPEVVPSAAGILVPPGNIEALAEALIALLGAPARRSEMGSAGLQAVAAHDWPVVARGFIEELERPAR
ncbi:MAG: glycosyltransferase family 4 protein [Chloroflexota bacterium]|nr:glycosyltransferase family 4 protein [Dehalococcoidia bacterium]MDW8254688.1 glycosyltransferase family 4 protein [Chloroflexota bacterium]